MGKQHEAANGERDGRQEPAARGTFYVLDGVDGCGKTTQARRLTRALEADGRRPLHVRDPGTTSTGEGLRALLLDPDVPMNAETETLLFVAARREMLRQSIEPALAAGRDVVCERFHASTFAYQAVAGDLGEERVLELMAAWAGEPEPDHVLLLELDVETALERARARGRADRFEGRGSGFLRRVAEGYLRYAALKPNAVRIDARGSEDEVAERIQMEVLRGAS